MKQIIQQQNGYSAERHKQKHFVTDFGSPGKSTAYTSIPGQARVKSRLTFAIILICCLSVWLVLAFITRARLTFLAPLTGVVAGFIYGKNSHTKISGIGVALIIFMACSIIAFTITIYAQSGSLGMSAGEIIKNFGIAAFAVGVVDQLIAMDWVYLCLGAILSGIFACKISKKHRNIKIKTKIEKL